MLSPVAAETLLRDLERSARVGEHGVALRVHAGRGRPDAHLVADADHDRFDLVIVGQRHHALLDQLWNGSVARGVLTTAPMSVGCVPLVLGEADTSFRPPRIVVIGVDLADGDPRTLAHAIGYAEDDAVVHVATVLEPALGDAHATRTEAWAKLNQLTRPHGRLRPTQLLPHVLEGEPAEQLLALAARVGADLVVLGARNRSLLSRALLGSVAREVVEASPLPVLLVPGRSA